MPESSVIPASCEAGSPGVLVVDLDGALIRTDMLVETFWSVLGRDLRHVPVVAAHLFLGRAQLKGALAARAEIDPAALPYNDEVLRRVRDWRAAGGRTVLVTASDQRIATAIAGGLGCFDEVHGSDGTTNLKGAAKAGLLRGRFGAGRFDYIGDSRADLEVWRHARRAITVDAPGSLRRAVDALAPAAEHLGRPARPAVYLRALRPHQWLKNVLIFLPPLAAHQTSAAVWGAALAAFVAFSLVASSVYLVNDLLDLAADRAHARKRHRPLASGALPILHGTLMAPVLLGSGFLVAVLFAPPAFVALLLGYVALTTAYSLVLKRLLVIDICVLAGLYTVRVFAGGVATGVVLSPWLLAFSIFIFLSLAAVKRQAELVGTLGRGREGVSGRAYLVSDLPIVAMMALSSGYVAVLVMALYINTEAVSRLYTSPLWLWGVCPVLLFWISRVVMLAHRGRMDDDPVVFAIRDPVSLACGALIAGIVIAGTLL